MGSLPLELASVAGSGLALLAAGIFAVAALHKIRTFTEFTGFVAGYRLLPAILVRPVSAMLVLLEMIAVFGALTGWGPPAYLPAGLLLLYALAVGVNLGRGHTDVDCGCGGAPMPLSVSLVVRNLLLAIAFLWAAGKGSPLVLAVDRLDLLFLASSFALCLGICYAAVGQLLANRGIHQRLWVQAT